MLYRTIGLLFLALAVTSCGGSKVSVQDSWLEQDAERKRKKGIAPGEMLAIFSVSPSMDEDLVECVESALHKHGRKLELVSAREFRDAMFPWFEPGLAPDSPEKLGAVMDKAGVSKRVDELRLRYLVALSGGTVSTPGSWGGCVGGGMGAACIGGMSWDKESDWTAHILDLKSLREVGQIEASGTGKTEVGMLVLIPYFVASAAESDTCAALAGRIVAFLKDS